MSQACTKSADLILVQRRDGCDRRREHDRSQRTRSWHHGHADSRGLPSCFFYLCKLITAVYLGLSCRAMFALVMAIA